MVRMLMEVAAGNVLDDRDIVLARAAARWAHTSGGWRPHLHNSFVFERNGLHYWVLADQALSLEIRVGQPGIWHPHLRARIDHVGHALNVLAAEELIPARFSTLARAALDDFAEALQRSGAVILETGADLESADEPRWLQVQAETLQIVVDQARRFAGVPLAVMT